MTAVEECGYIVLGVVQIKVEKNKCQISEFLKEFKNL